MGASSTKVNSTQNATVTTTQQFSGMCNITCQNVDKDIAVTLIDTNLQGGVDITQTCSTDASCTIASANDSTADVLFKAANSANAKSAAAVSWVDPGEFDSTSITSRQDIRMATNQAVTQSCNIGSYNEMDNVSVFAANSNIGGSITIAQSGSANGQCALNNSMQAASAASASETSTGQSGGKGKGHILMMIIVAVTIIALAGILGKIFSSQSVTGAMKTAQKKALQAQALVGCPGGMKPVLDKKTKLPILNPRTGKPICPIPPPGTGVKPSIENIGSQPSMLAGSQPIGRAATVLSPAMTNVSVPQRPFSAI